MTNLDFGLPGLRAVALRHGGHVPRQHGARPQPAHPHVVPECLGVIAVHQARAVAAVEVVGLVAVVVAAEAAHSVPELGRHRELQEADAVPQEFDAWNIRRVTINIKISFIMSLCTHGNSN